jgi:hypothetical protein
MLLRSILAFIFIVSAYKWGDWKNWRKYYASMLFFGMGDLIYILVFHDKPLWKFVTDYLVYPLNELFVIFTIFFSSVLIFLTNYPKKLFHQTLYNAFWISLYMLIEIFTINVHMIEHFNGWTIWWSLLHNTIQFPIVALHHKNPVLAWIIALFFLVVIMKIFKVSYFVKGFGILLF